MLPDKNGVPLRDHMMQLKKQTGVAPKGLLPPVEFPDTLAHIWSIFISLHKRRGGGFGPAYISYEQMKAWGDLHEFQLRPWEVKAIEALDDIYMRVSND